MHHAFHRGMRIVADGIGEFVGRYIKLARARLKLRGDWIVRIVRIDQRVHGRRDRDGVARGHLRQRISFDLRAHIKLRTLWRNARVRRF